MGNKNAAESKSSAGAPSAAGAAGAPSADELASMKPAGRKGWDFRMQAVALLNKRSMFGKEQRMEQAAELAEKSATQFKLAKMYGESAESYRLQADALARGDEERASTQALLAAAQAFVLADDIEAAAEIWRGSIEQLKDSGKFDRAAKEVQKMADAFKKDQQMTRAAEAYEEAADLYEMDGRGEASARKCKEEMALILGSSEEFTRAAELFEEIATKCLEKNLTKFHAKGYYQKAAFCNLARGDAVAARDTLETATISDPRFPQSREGKLAAAVVDLCAENNPDGLATFQQTLREYNEITAFSNWESGILFSIKQRYFPEGDARLDDELAGGDDAGADAGADAADDLL